MTRAPRRGKRVARARRNFGAGSRHSRLTQWLGPAAQDYVNVASGGATLISSFQFENPATIVRTRGQVSVRLQAYTADLTVAGAFGIGVVSQEAFAAGVASMPEPFTDSDWGGWFVWRTFAMRFEFDDATGLTFPASVDFEVDSKAMRKIGTNEVLVFIAESQTGAYAMFDGTRSLIKLA